MNISDIHEGLHIKDYAHILSRRRDVFILFLVTTVLAVGIGSFIIRPVYRATATLLIDPESPNVLTTTGMVELQSQNYLSYKEYYQSQVEIITSYTLAKKVFDEFNLIQAPDYVKAKEPVKKFLKTVKVEPIRDTRLFKLSVDNKDAEVAARIANRIAELYVMRNLYYISKTEIMNLLKNEYLKLEAKLSEYAKVYKEGHPEMIKLRNEMAELMDRIGEEKKSTYNYTNIEEYLKGTSQHTLSGFKANNISIQDMAEKPVVPIRPKKLLNILMAAIVGILGGIGLAFFFEYLDDTVKELEDVGRLVGWPYLGSIPKIDGGVKKEFEKDLYVHIKSKEPVAEVYRSIRTAVLFSSTEEHPVRSAMITSPGPQEGKTTTLCNLGIAIAQSGKRILLVDADMRKPRLHEVFGNENRNGLSDFLCGQKGFETVIQKTQIENLSLVNGGTYPPNPSELLASHKMKEFIETAEKKFDFILFDTPPISMLTDGVVISRVVDGVIMVLESGKTSKRALARISQILRDAKARIIGTVLNRVSLNSLQYYYYPYHADVKQNKPAI